MRIACGLWLCLLVPSLLLTGASAADDKKTDPTGNWTFVVKTQNGEEIKIAIKFKKEGDKLTGTFNIFNMDVQVENGECKEGNISFQVAPEVNGNKVVAKFTGKVDGDTIKGKFERDRDGEKVVQDWEAKRDKEGK